MKINRPFEREDCPIVYLVSTPIGNRDDITLRALKVFKEADIIACEDTRNTASLLKYYEIEYKELVSLYAQIEKKEAERLVKRVKEENLKLAYCSDAGMPGISDPGALLVKECYLQGVAVTIIPGPSASLSALVLSSIDSADFSFYGFLPTKDGQEKAFLDKLKDREETLIFYESPKRIVKTLSIMRDVFSKDREVSLIRELTKIHEEVINGSLDELCSNALIEKGECVIVVSGCKDRSIDIEDVKEEIIERYKRGESISYLSKEIASEHSISKNQVYKLALDITSKEE